MVDILGLFPDFLPREPDSVFRRYVEANEEELEVFSDDIEAIKISRQVEEASGQDLDEIGRIFGIVGKRRNRTDDEYRQYLKSVVQAFAGRGIEFSMEKGISAAFDVDIDDVEIEEDTTNVEYDIVFDVWPAHNLDTLATIADIVDPSGVEMNTARYNIDPDTMVTADEVTIGTGASTTDTMVTADAVTTATGSPSDFVWNQNDWNFTEWAGGATGFTAPPDWDNESWDNTTWT